MNRINLPPEATDGTEIERIKARIRQQRFTRFAPRRWLRWTFGIGAGSGLTLGLWQMAHRYLAPAWSGPMVGFGTSPVDDVISALLYGVVGGFGLSLVAVGLFAFFRPAYVALFYSPEEFEREYGDRPPQVR
jgi:hypothetical protein